MKLTKTYNQMLRNFEEFKSKRREHEEMMNDRKKDNTINNKKLVRELKEKAIRS